MKNTIIYLGSKGFPTKSFLTKVRKTSNFTEWMPSSQYLNQIIKMRPLATEQTEATHHLKGANEHVHLSGLSLLIMQTESTTEGQTKPERGTLCKMAASVFQSFLTMEITHALKNRLEMWYLNMQSVPDLEPSAREGIRKPPSLSVGWWQLTPTGQSCDSGYIGNPCSSILSDEVCWQHFPKQFQVKFFFISHMHILSMRKHT